MPAVPGVAVVGLGAIGRVHANNLAAQRRCGLEYVVDRSEVRARAESERLGASASTSFDTALEDPAVHAVVIATPAATHPRLVADAAAAGKHVFCEKPLALDVAGGRAAVEAVERAGVLLQVGFHRRFDSDFLAVRRRIAAGELGEPFSLLMSMRDPHPPPIALLATGEGTLLHDTACHDLDAARWLFGEIAEIRTVGAALSSNELQNIGQIDHAVSVLTFQDGALGAIENSLACGYGFDCRCEVLGSEGRMRIDPPPASSFLERFADAYRRELDAFVSAIGGDEPAGATGEDGFTAVVLAAAAERSLHTGRKVRLRQGGGNGDGRYEMVDSTD